MGKTRHLLSIVLLASVAAFPAFAAPVVEVAIEGIGGEVEKNVRALLSIEQQRRHPMLTESRIRRLHQKAANEIKAALQPYGYYRPAIESTLTREGTESWRAVYVIDPGPPLPVASFDFRLSGAGLRDPAFLSLTADLPLQEGEALDQTRYEAFKGALAKVAEERGYFDARFTEHRIRIDLEAYRADIVLHYDTGPRYRFGEVTYRQDILDPGLMGRYVPFKRGAPYDITNLVDLQQALNDSDYFSSVSVQAGRDHLDGLEVPVGVDLLPRKRHRYTFGIGYGTDTGVRGKIGWEMPRVNRRGHRFDSEIRASEIGGGVSARYRIPMGNPRTDQLIYSASMADERTDARTSRIGSLGASLIHARGMWRESLSLTYQEERYEVADERARSALLMPGISWSRIWAKDPIYAPKGGRVILDLRGATRQLVSDTDFAQGRTGLKLIEPLGPGGRLIARGSVGSTWAPEFDQLPASVRFFAGGAQSVRGYAYESLGPTDAQGQLIGGKHLLVGSIEYEHALGEKLGAAVFYDVGNAINAFSDPLKRGAGVGLRWRSPVGPIRLDVASALSEEGRPWRIHLNIGPDL